MLFSQQRKGWRWFKRPVVAVAAFPGMARFRSLRDLWRRSAPAHCFIMLDDRTAYGERFWLGLLLAVYLYDVPFTKVVEARQANAALKACGHLTHVILEVSQARDGPIVNDFTVPQDPC